MRNWRVKAGKRRAFKKCKKVKNRILVSKFIETQLFSWHALFESHYWSVRHVPSGTGTFNEVGYTTGRADVLKGYFQ